MNLEVDCYSGRTADERPVRFSLDGHEYMVEEVLDQWYGLQDSLLRNQHSTEGFKRTYLNLWLNVVRRTGCTEAGVFLRFLG